MAGSLIWGGQSLAEFTCLLSDHAWKILCVAEQPPNILQRQTLCMGAKKFIGWSHTHNAIYHSFKFKTPIASYPSSGEVKEGIPQISCCQARFGISGSIPCLGTFSMSSFTPLPERWHTSISPLVEVGASTRRGQSIATPPQPNPEITIRNPRAWFGEVLQHVFYQLLLSFAFQAQ